MFLENFVMYFPSANNYYEQVQQKTLKCYYICVLEFLSSASSFLTKIRQKNESIIR
jgi:hypothetical protein